MTVGLVTALSARLDDLGATLAERERRDGTRPRPDVRRAVNTTMEAIDTHAVRAARTAS